MDSQDTPGVGHESVGLTARVAQRTPGLVAPPAASGPPAPEGAAQTLADPADPASDFAPAANRHRANGLPFAALLGLVAGLAVFATSQTPLRDIDVFWHVLAGQQLIAGIAPHDLGSGWSFAPQPLPWTSTQWLSEVLFAGLYQAFGWAGIAAFRVTTAALAVGLLALTTLRGRSRAIAGFPFLLATGMLAFVSQDRPAQFTLIGAALLGGVLVAGLTCPHRLPPWYVLLPATTLWANLHGGWVLVPGVLVMIAVGVTLDSGPRPPVVRRAALLALGAVAAGCLTPSGLAGVTAPLRFSEAAVLIKEWAPVEPTSTLGWLTMGMLALFFLGWSVRHTLPRSEAFVVLALMTFTWSANRNLAPGMALMAPLAAHALCRAFPGVTRPEPRWSTPAGVFLGVLLSVVGVVSVATTANLPYNSQPLGLAQRIASLPAGQRVLNDYNTSGAVLFFGGPQTKVAIDGRTDRYGAHYIQQYVDLNALRGDWEALLKALQPTAALLEADAPLTRLLLDERGWRQVGPEEADHVLLLPPATPTRSGAAQPRAVDRRPGVRQAVGRLCEHDCESGVEVSPGHKQLAATRGVAESRGGAAGPDSDRLPGTGRVAVALPDQDRPPTPRASITPTPNTQPVRADRAGLKDGNRSGRADSEVRSGRGNELAPGPTRVPSRGESALAEKPERDPQARKSQGAGAADGRGLAHGASLS